jgi:IS30 family transposase
MKKSEVKEMQKPLHTAKTLAAALNMSRQALHKALKKGRIEEAEYNADGVHVWTPEQVEKIKKTFVKEG